MKKLIFSILPAFLFAFISCMNMSSGSGENGSVRVALPGSSRAAYNKDDADKFIVRLYNDDFDKTEEGTLGGVIEFGELEPGTYTAEAEAWNTAENLLEGSGSAEIKVKAGETTDCTIKMILEGVFYSKYMLFRDYFGNMYAYDYSSCAEKKKWALSSSVVSYSNFAETNNGIYYMYVGKNESGTYYDPVIRSFADTDKKNYTLPNNSSDYFDAYYDSTTDIYWVAYAYWSDSAKKLYLCKKTDKYAEIIKSGVTFPFSSACIATQGENFYYSFNSSDATNQCPDSIGYATFYYTTRDGSANPITTKTLADFDVSGTITDMAVLEDGRVAVLVCDTSSYSSYDSNNQTVIYNYNVANNSTVTSRGALVLLSSDLSKVEKVLGWSGERTISATGSSSGYNVQWDKITAYIPEYEERNSHFYGPVKIVAIRPKELVIADCGANFVLPDYIGKKNGKMFTHNRLMTVNLRNFAIGCKKEFSESELKFQNLTISGNLEFVTAGWTNLSAENEK
ncbi:hypothetical protein [Treponema succinifaciens]|uniref:hypothetical protein n=1 Tax=Treponema succinifaciens TaxID=167 RepID=UPI003FCC56BA